jgi:hypothetical protein
MTAVDRQPLTAYTFVNQGETIMKTPVVLSVLLMLALQGCGSLVHGTSQELKITTIPPGATATIGTQSCKTPCTLTVKRGSQSLLVEKGNYKRSFDVEKDFNFGATICGNVLWLLPGAIIDIAAGGAWEIRPVNLRLNASDERTQ